jgi:hypothetical protein
MSDDEDQERLIAALRHLAPSIKKSTDRAWSRRPALRVIDCILSLNRAYDRFVVKRLDQFEHEHPNVQSVSDLDVLIATFPSPHHFMASTLAYNHQERANTLAAVVKWLVGRVGGAGSAREQSSKIEDWARSAEPTDYAPLRIRGFGLAAFQYLRMLFGANTTKPDIHICSFVKFHVGHGVSPSEALRLLERSAPTAGIFLRDLDTTIWEERARARKKPSGCES